MGLIPTLGGIPIFAGYLAGILLIYWQLPPVDNRLPLRGVIIGTAVVFIGGLLDDRYDLAPRWQFLLQFVAAVIANYHIAFLERIANPFGGSAELFLLKITPTEIIFATPVAWAITIFWIMGMMNAINWLDGLDGLAAGVGAIACTVFALHGFLNLGQTTIAAFPLALAGALLGFLFFNFAPARIFLGSAGVYIVSYNIATLSFLAPAKFATLLLVLALPLLDGLWRIIDRMRHGRNPFSGDRGHLHFMLSDSGWPTQRIVLTYYAIAMILGAVALLAPSGLIKFGVLALLGITILGFLVWYSGRKTPHS
jgi:UDP-GlcNAc:undecaprenyl-phosphate GlcNAc-1-phosphate transferase